MDRKPWWISSSSLLSASGSQTPGLCTGKQLNGKPASFHYNKLLLPHGKHAFRSHVDFPRDLPVLQQLNVIQQAACSALSQHTISSAAFCLIKCPVCPLLEPLRFAFLTIRNNGAVTGADGNHAFRKL